MHKLHQYSHCISNFSSFMPRFLALGWTGLDVLTPEISRTGELVCSQDGTKSSVLGFISAYIRIRFWANIWMYLDFKNLQTYIQIYFVVQKSKNKYWNLFVLGKLHEYQYQYYDLRAIYLNIQIFKYSCSSLVELKIKARYFVMYSTY